MKKILFYSPFIKVGGIEKVSIEYLKGFLSKGCKVDLIVDFDMGKDGNTFEYAIPEGVNFRYIKSEKASKFIYFFRTLGKKNKFFNLFLYSFLILIDFYYYHTKMKRIVLEGKYDCVISFYQFLPSYITSIKSCNHIIWIHNSIEHFFGGFKSLFKKNYEKKLNKYDYIITISDEMTKQLTNLYPELPKEKIKRIYNPFSFDFMRDNSLDTSNLNFTEKKLLTNKFICSVSRIDEAQKDITSLIKAYHKLYNQNSIEHYLYIIGDGPHKIELENLVKNLDLAEKVLFLGKKTNPYIWMRNADLFILSSKYEGFGLVLVESMAVETFVIATNCKTGPKEILLNGECGDLVEIGNINMLAEKINYAIKNKDYRKNKIKNASFRINEFSINNIINEAIKIL